jgi:two-component system NtrC family response regulator
MTPYTAILVCHRPDRLAALSAALAKHGLEQHSVADGAAALRAAKRHRPDLVFAYHELPDSSGLKVIQSLKKRYPQALGIVFGPSLSLEEKRRISDEGADAYIEADKGDTEEIQAGVANLIARKQIGIIGRSEKLLQIIETVESIAPTKVTVLISGESGTGKELIARAIHARSSRRDKPFVAVNCGALPQGVLESELFGHEKGSFTGAVAQRKGRFEIADGGTLLLDEVGEMTADTQVKLLRVLEEERFMRVGGSQDVKVDVRVLASTNSDLRRLVEEGAFRIDLFYRLNVVPILVPPLRERKEDIPAIFLAIVEETCRKNGVEFGGIEDDALAVLKNYYWPGNARELRNLAESLIVLSGGKRIGLESLPKHIISGGESRNLPVVTTRPRSEGERDLFLWRLAEIDRRLSDLAGLAVNIRDTLARTAPGEASDCRTSDAQAPGAGHGATVRNMERELVERTLKATGGNRKKTAKLLGIGERTLYRRMKDYKLR